MGHCFCPNIIIRSDVWGVGAIGTVQVLSFRLAHGVEGQCYCPSPVLLTGVRAFGVMFTVQALSYCLMYGPMGLLLLSKCCQSGWCMGGVGKCYCPSPVILTGVCAVGVLASVQAFSYSLVYGQWASCYCQTVVRVAGVWAVLVSVTVQALSY